MLLKQLFDALESVEKFYIIFSITKLAENKKQGVLQSMISCISTHFLALQGYKLKAYRVSNYHLRLQPKKVK